MTEEPKVSAVSDVLINVLDRETAKSKKNGLFLVDVPTGYGKSYAAFQLLANHLLDEGDSRRFFFITPQKKNLPSVDDILSLLPKSKRERYRNDVLLIESWEDAVFSSTIGTNEEDVPGWVSKLPEFEKLKSLVLKRRLNPRVKEREFSDAERAFRHAVEDFLFNEASSVSARCELLRNDRGWKWLGRLYPVAFTCQARVVLMTVSKTIYPFDTIIDGVGDLIDSNLTKNSVVIIDEFDASKKCISDYCLEVFLNKEELESSEDDPDDLQAAVDKVASIKAPEEVLETLMSKARVIGLSATATVDSVLCNYNLQYLNKCNGGIEKISESDPAYYDLKNAFDSQNEGYDNVDIEVTGISGGTAWNKLVGDDRADNAKETCEMSGLPTYDLDRILRVVNAFKYFAQHKEISCMLALAMKLYKSDDSARAIIEKLFGWIQEYQDPNGEIVYVFLDNKDFVQRWSEIRELLAKGKKVFVLTSYGTVGTGVNLQYEIPDGCNTVNVFKREGSQRGKEEMDIEAIYLDRVTNLAPFRGDRKKSEKLTYKELFVIRQLKECGDIKNDEDYQAALKIFKDPDEQDSAEANVSEVTPAISLMRTNSARRKASCVVNQALGRICRTNNKSPVIHVLYDLDLVKRMDVKALGDSLVTKEYEALLNDINMQPNWW